MGHMPHNFSELREKLSKYLEKEQIDKIYEAYVFASDAHKDQTRVSGEPYITHPLAVSMILADLKLDYQSILTALLHDVLEDTPVSKQELAHKYSATVADLVDGVSKLKQINFSTKAEAQAENLRKMMLAMVQDIRVIIIKMADRMHNMQTLGALRPEKRRRIAKETLEIYAPIANRLGMHYFKNQFELLGFSYLYPMRARVLQEEINKKYKIKEKLIVQIKKDIANKLDQAEINNYKLIGREKNLYSIYKKMKNKHLSFKQIMDIYAFRLDVNTKDECYRALGIVHAMYKPVPNKFKDYIAIPKINSYQALHTVLVGPHGVPIEIQIRTHEMGRMAENGVAAHWLYKSSDSSVTSAQMRAAEWFSSLLEMQKSADDSLEFVENLKIDLFPDELFVFTPGGDIIKLPSGSTAVDFAYDVHTDIGNSCIATKVDNRLVPLSTILQNGQTIEIITGKNTRPNPAWLSFVKTGKARGSIRHFLRTQKQSDLKHLGKKLLATELSLVNIDINKLSTGLIPKLLKEYSLIKIEELYQEIGNGTRSAFFVAKRILELLKTDTKIPDKSISKKTLKPISIKGTEGMAVSFASCCYPVPGDAIVGFFVDNKGLEVHRENCKKLLSYKNYNNKDSTSNIPLCWDENYEGYFKTTLAVSVINKKGVLAELAMIISRCNANIQNVNTEDYDGGAYTLITMLLEVIDNNHINTVIRQIKKVKNVSNVIRK